MIDLPRHPLLNVLEPPDQELASDEKKEKPKESHGSERLLRPRTIDPSPASLRVLGRSNRGVPQR